MKKFLLVFTLVICCLSVSAQGRKALFNGVAPTPEFPNWVTERLVYPDSVIASRQQGWIAFSVFIDETGKVTDVKIVRGLSPELDAVVVDVAKSSPDWIPAEKNGKKVAVKYTFSVFFRCPLIPEVAGL